MTMHGAVTIIIVKTDLTIMGANESKPGESASGQQRALFETITTNHPDVIVLDCRAASDRGVEAIEELRAQTSTPILVVCNETDAGQRKYRLAGAVDCLVAPFDLLAFNSVLQDIARLRVRGAPKGAKAPSVYRFPDINFDPKGNTISKGSASLKLTTAENRLLAHFAERPWKVCSRTEISKQLYGSNQPVSERAIDVVVARLRKKLDDVRGGKGENLIKTEFRLGYMFMSDVIQAPNEQAME